MKAAVYEAFASPITIQTVPDPTPTPDGVVIQVMATGLCRSDWHGWMGHDPDITLPHVPGHELAGIIAAVGKDVRRWQVGDRVTLPFVCGCGAARNASPATTRCATINFSLALPIGVPLPNMWPSTTPT